MDKSNKYIYIILILVGILIVGGLAAAAFQEQETKLSLNSAHATIGANQTYYIINGNTDLNATVKLSSSELNLNNVSVNVDSNGDFKYKVSVPQNVTEVNIALSSVVNGKSENNTNLYIDRPATYLSLDNVNFTDNDTFLTVSGNTDPNANITISSSDLNIGEIKLTADNNGLFSYQLSIPNDKNDFEIKVESQVIGKKIGVDSLSIIRTLTPEPEPKVETDSSSYSSDSSDASAGEEVIITEYGEKYHNHVHGNMKHIDYVPLSYAKQYYEPCKICY